MIFTISRDLLAAFYDDSCSAEKIDALLRYHEKICNAMSGILHLTTNVDAISRSGQMLCSAGGLGGCIYGVPIYESGKVHSLGTYLIHDELPMFLRRQGRDLNIKALGLYPTRPKLGYIDYLLFGEQYARIYDASHALQQAISRDDVKRLYDNEYAIASTLLNILASHKLSADKIKQCIKAFDGSIILRALYFEIVLEYVFLFQNDNEANKAASHDELYNRHAKNLIFQLNPSLAKHFSLSNFRCSPVAIGDYLKQQSDAGRVIEQFDQRHFYDFLLRRLSFYITYYLTDNTENLFGHVLFRHFGERAHFETETAKILWQEAAANGFNVLTYRMPKGEIGLLPTDRSVKIFVGEIDETMFIKGGQVNARLSKSLVNNAKLSVMRNPYSRSPGDVRQFDADAQMIGFVRHGESVANLEGRFGGRDDSPLTKRGEDQAAAIGNELLRLAFKPRRVVTSSLSRAQRTAAIIAPILGIAPDSVVVDARFDEYDFGSYNGKLKQGVGSEEFMAIPDREDPQHFYARIREAWNEYQRLDGNTLIVSHAFVRHMINCALEGSDVARFHDYAANEETSRLSFYEPRPI